MTRIFDAFRKAGAARPEPVVPEPVLEPARGAHLSGARAVEERRGPALLCPPLVVGDDIPGDVVQQMVTLRVNLDSALAERSTRVVGFVASQAEEGTTTVAHQFAVTLARDERLRVVLVDAHASHPSLEFDAGRRAVRAVKDSSQGSNAVILPNLHGWPVPDSARSSGVLQQGEVRPVVEGLSSSYDWVIMDLPPVLESPDSGALAALADVAVLVVRAGRSKRPVIGRATDLLRKAGARVVGTVLNRRRLEIPDFIYKRI